MLTDDLNNNSPSSDAAPPQGNPMGLDKSNKKMMGGVAGGSQLVGFAGGSGSGSSTGSNNESSDMPSGMQKPKPGLKKKFTPKVIVGLLILVMLVVGSGAALFLSRQSQDVRQQASEPLIENCGNYSIATCQNHEACELQSNSCQPFGFSQTACESRAGCSYTTTPGSNACTGNGGKCSGTYQEPGGYCTGSNSGCSLIADSNECYALGCTWVSQPTTKSCNGFTTETACNGWFGCDWNPCSNYSFSETACNGANNCSWTTTPGSSSCSGTYQTCENKPGYTPPPIAPSPSPGNTPTCETDGNTLCVGNEVTGNCYQGGQNNAYACWALRGANGEKITSPMLSENSCICGSEFNGATPRFEYGDWWCFDYASAGQCTPDVVNGVNTSQQCSISPQNCSGATPPPGGGTGGPPPSPTPAPTLSCNSVCTSNAQCQATNPNWTCTNTSADGVGWNAATPWAGPLDLGGLPGSGPVQGQAAIVIANGTKLHQEFWRNNIGYTRSTPISNNRVIWNQAPDWTNTQTQLPGSSGSVESYSLVTLPNGKIIQSMWRNNQGWTREVSIDGNGNPQWTSAPAWGGPIAPLALCEGSPMQSQAEWILNGTLGQAIWCGNKGYNRTVPMNGSTVLWGQAAAWSQPILPSSSLPGSNNIQSQVIVNMGNDYFIQGYWGDNQGWSREVPVGRRCRLASNISSNVCEAALPSPTPPPPTPLTSPSTSPSPTPIGPMCMSISMSIAQPELGDSVNFTCGQVSGVERYEFRVIEPSGNIVSLDATGQVSSSYTISQSGKFYAQCRICTASTERGCNTEWEPIPGVPTIPPSPTSDPQIDPVFDSGSDR